MSGGHDLGTRAEELAEADYVRGGWTVLDRNWRAGHRELDLVVERDGLVAFVEVRARSRLGYGHPLATIGRLKRRDLEHAARRWIAAHGRSVYAYRFDVVAVVPDGRGGLALERVEDAWRVG